MASIPLYQAAQLRRVEAAAAGQPLMQRAGRAAAERAVALSGERSGRILILAGPGNNGGDAFEAARLLGQRFFEPCVIFRGQPQTLPPDAAAAYQRFVEAGGRTLDAIPERVGWSLIIDGLFGIGLQRPVGGIYAELVAQANALAVRDACPLLALDCPSGLDADTGTMLGTAIRASHTLTFIAAKPGLLTGDGPDHCGEISVAGLELDAEKIVPASGRTIAIELFAEHLVARSRNSHKGHYGNAGVLGGAPGMVGAALLTARAALRLGSGRVYVGLLDTGAPTVDLQQPELMLRRPDALLKAGLTALACGPGLGDSPQVAELLEAACRMEIPLVLDADALNLLAREGEAGVLIATRTPPTLLTPHPAEAARLLDCTVAEIQAERIAAARELAERYQAVVALKGCGTVVADADGDWFINTSGNAGLSTAGSGDVLTGIACALLAQGWPARAALLAAVHLHGRAAEGLVADGCGPVGLTAGETIDAARRCFNAWLRRPSAD